MQLLDQQRTEVKRGQYVAPASELPIPQRGESERSKRDSLRVRESWKAQEP